MHFFPFIYKKYVIYDNFLIIQGRIKERIDNKKINSNIGFIFYEKSFLIGKGLSNFKDNLSYWPIMRSWINFDKRKQRNNLTVIIYPFVGGLLTLIFGWSIAIFGMYIFYKKRQYGDFFSLFIFVIIFYILLIYTFNKRSKKYIEFLEKEVLGNAPLGVVFLKTKKSK